MPTQTGSIDLKAQKQAHDDAEKKATNFLSADSSGIMIYDGTSGAQSPSNPSASTKNVFIDSDSVDIRIGTKVSASFGENVTIGRTEFDSTETPIPTSVQIGRNVFKLVENSDKSSIVEFIDFRNDDGTATFTATYSGDGRTKTYTLAFSEHSDPSVAKVYLNDVLLTRNTDYTITTATLMPLNVNFITTPAWGDRIRIVYDTYDAKSAKAFSFGPRATGNVGGYSFTQGVKNVAAGAASSAIGNSCAANGRDAHAEGYFTKANGSQAHAEGNHTQADAPCSHAEGGLCITVYDADYSHAEGYNCIAYGRYSHAQNHGTVAYGEGATAIGRWNARDTNEQYAFVIGNGTETGDESGRSNAFAVEWNGNVISKGMVGQVIMYAGTTPPNGWLLCDGSEVPKANYQLLYSIIGDTYGQPSSSDYFKLPNFCGRTPVGVGESNATGHTAHTLGQMAGNEDAIVPYHNHTTATGGGGHTHTVKVKYKSNYVASGTNRDSVNGISGNPTSTGIASIDSNTGAHNHTINYAGTSGNATGANMQPYLGINFIINTGRNNYYPY